MVVHGNDLTTLGLDEDLDWLYTELSKSFELKKRGRVGEGVEGSNDMRILNRIVELHPKGPTYEVRVHSDATAAIGIARRRGLGKIRHLDCSDLWIQEKVKNNAISLHKIAGAENPADAFTKYVDRAILEKAMGKINLRRNTGRPQAAPDTLGLQQEA